MHAQLRVVQKQANVQQVRLLSETVIGRSADCNLKIASTQVSRRHCRVVVNDLGVYVEDLCSANGTYLDGKRLLPNQLTLAPAGSQLVIGPATFAVEYRNSGVIRPELGASLPQPEAPQELLAPEETTSLPLAEVEAAFNFASVSSPDDTPFTPFAPFVSESVPSPAESIAVNEPPKRMRSLFGLFQRGNKKAASPSAPVPFLPTEPESAPDQAEAPDALEPEPVADPVDTETATIEDAPQSVPNFAFEIDSAAEAPAESSDADNPFRQFSQF